MTTNQETTVTTKNKPAKCDICGKRRVLNHDKLCKKCGAEDVKAQLEEATELHPQKKDNDKQKKIKSLVVEIKATLEHMKRQTKFMEQVKGNKQFVFALANSNAALSGQVKLFVSTLNACTGRKVEVVAISDTHTTGWGVEMTLPDKQLKLVTYQYTQVLDVKMDVQARKVANAAAWKYFWAEDVDMSTKLWTEVK